MFLRNLKFPRLSSVWIGLFMSLIFFCKPAHATIAITLSCPNSPSDFSSTATPLVVGTFCKVDILYTGIPATSVEIKIGGETAHSEVFLFARPTYPKTLYFDSTHFADDANVTISCTVNNLFLLTENGSKSAKVYNKAIIWGNQKPNDGVGDLNFGK